MRGWGVRDGLNGRGKDELKEVVDVFGELDVRVGDSLLSEVVKKEWVVSGMRMIVGKVV